MPKSKKDKKIYLTQTQKKGLELKQRIVEEIRSCVDKYERIFTFSVQNMRNCKLKDLREKMKDSRFVFGKNRVMGLALGRGPEDEYQDNLHQLSRRLQGQTGLLFTDKSNDDIFRFFDSFSESDFARSGTEATQLVVIGEGPLKGLSHSMEPQLRRLGLPTALKQGVITLLSEYKVCDIGDKLTPEQARILKVFGHRMAEFRVTVESMWSKDGTYEVFSNRRPEKIVSSKICIKPTVNEEGEAVFDVTADDNDDSDVMEEFIDDD